MSATLGLSALPWPSLSPQGANQSRHFCFIVSHSVCCVHKLLDESELGWILRVFVISAVTLTTETANFVVNQAFMNFIS